MTSLANKVALVTAGSRGLGAQIVTELASRGADVAFTYASQKQAADELVARIEDFGRRAVCFPADARDFSLAHEVTEEVRRRLGELDILVCSAGIARGGATWKLTENDWDDVVDVSLKGAFNYIHAAAPMFVDRKGGKIVCIGSINGLRGRMGSLSYNVAKAGLVGLVKTVAAEMGKYNVNANVVAPGYIETTTQVNTPELIKDLVLKECAIKRLGTPQDIAPVVAFLCSEEARHVTGQVIKGDAGQYL